MPYFVPICIRIKQPNGQPLSGVSVKTHRRFVFKLLSNVMKHASDTNLSAGLGGDCFISISKLSCFPLSFFVSVFNAHGKSVIMIFARYSSAPRCRARDTHII